MIARFVVFIGIAFGLLGAIHYYLWLRLARDPHWPAPWTAVLGWFFVVGAVGMPVAAIVGSGRAHSVGGQIAVWSAYVLVVYRGGGDRRRSPRDRDRAAHQRQRWR